MLPNERYQANLRGLLPLVYIIPSYIAHLAILFAIFHRRNKDALGTMFFRTYAFSSIMAILNSIFIYPYSRIRYTPCLMFIFDSLPERSFLVTFLYALNFYFNYAELVASLLLNLNRASVVFLKARYQRFWAKALYPTFVIILFLSALLVLNSWFSDVSLQYIDPNDKEKGYDWTARKKIEWLRNSFILLGLLIAGAIGSLFSNIYVIFYLIVSRKNKQTFSENSNKDIQFRLFVFAGISFLIHVVYAFFQVLFIVIPDRSTIYLLIGIQAYVQDFINLSPPWILLFVCPQVRTRVFTRKFLSKPSSVFMLPSKPSASAPARVKVGKRARVSIS